MARTKSQYVCQQCGYSQTGWSGRCPECNTWGSLVETVVPASSGRGKGSKSRALSAPIQKLASIPSKKISRIVSGIPELDRVLGGGLVHGQAVLIAGEPGIGKSTILIQLADRLGNALYVSGEESAYQIKLRADRLGLKAKNVSFLEATDVDAVIASVEALADQGQVPQLLIIDSIQTMYTSDLSGMAGSVGQVRETSSRLVKLGKRLGMPVLLVGHVTKQGSVAGPATLMHIVDTVLWFEGDKELVVRMLRSIKNRFGPTDEIGLFTMAERGLVSVDEVGGMFLTKHEKPVPGSVVTSTLEGTRPLLVEIQSLVVRTHTPYPKRVAQGVDNRRLELLLAVLTRRVGLPLYEWDVFVNVVGGISLKEPAADLAAALSIASAFIDKPIDPLTVAVGEVGLLGEVRTVMAEERRLSQAKRQGYTKAVTARDFPTVSQAVQRLLRKK